MTDTDFTEADRPHTPVSEPLYSPQAGALLGRILLNSPALEAQMLPQQRALLRDLTRRFQRGEFKTPEDFYRVLDGIAAIDQMMILSVGLHLQARSLGVGAQGGSQGLLHCLELINLGFPRIRLVLDIDGVELGPSSPDGPRARPVALLLALGSVIALAREMLGRDSVVCVQLDEKDGLIDREALSRKLQLPVSAGAPSRIFLMPFDEIRAPAPASAPDEQNAWLAAAEKPWRVFGTHYLSSLLKPGCLTDGVSRIRVLGLLKVLERAPDKVAPQSYVAAVARILGQDQRDLAPLRASLMVTPESLGYYWPASGQASSQAAIAMVEAVTQVLYPAWRTIIKTDSIVLAVRDGAAPAPTAGQMLLGLVIGLLGRTLGQSAVTRVTLDWHDGEAVAGQVEHILGVPVEIAATTEIFLDPGALAAGRAAENPLPVEPVEDEVFTDAAEAFRHVIELFVNLVYSSDVVFDAPSRHALDELIDMLREGRRPTPSQYFLANLQFAPSGSELMLLRAGRLLRPYRLGVGFSGSGVSFSELDRCIRIYARGFPGQSVRWEEGNLVFSTVPDESPVFISAVVAFVSGCLGLVEYLLGEGAVRLVQVGWQVSDEFLEEAASEVGVPFRRGSRSAIFLNARHE